MKRIERFEREGHAIPEWLRWIPLAIEHAGIDPEERFEWARANIPHHSELRREREDDERAEATRHLDPEEIAILDRFRSLTPDERATFSALSQPSILRWWMGVVRRSADRNADVVELVERALD